MMTAVETSSDTKLIFLIYKVKEHFKAPIKSVKSIYVITIYLLYYLYYFLHILFYSVQYYFQRNNKFSSRSLP